MLSIIIPTLNEDKFLPNLLESVKAQDLDSEFEVIVADNHSTDTTRPIARSFGCRVVDGGNPAEGRNAGANAAQGDIFLFLDADVILPQGFIRTALDEFDLRYLEVACAKSRPITDDKDFIKFHELSNWFLETFQWLRIHGTGFCTMATRRVHERIGGFDQTMKLGEDNDYVRRAGKLGKYSVFKKAQVEISTRRLEKEGTKKITQKYALASACLLLKIDLPENVDYTFGDYADEPVKEDIPEIHT